MTLNQTTRDIKTSYSLTERRTVRPFACLSHLVIASLLAAGHVTTADFAEGSAAAWGAFAPEWEGVTASVSDATNLVQKTERRRGEKTIHLDDRPENTGAGAT